MWTLIILFYMNSQPSQLIVAGFTKEETCNHAGYLLSKQMDNAKFICTKKLISQ